MGPVTFDVEILKDDRPDQPDEKNVELPACWICNDTGMVMYRKKTDMGEYEYIAHCICPAGTKYSYDGQQCKVKSSYYIPWVAEVADPEMIAKDNIVDFYERHKNDEHVVKALEARGIKFKKGAEK
ncbi:hypothetical protein [Mahella australiensis]|uniref:Uncharacterized protein n=1 Tax=Mahella australiensis (strain DSM 15567 / CIP 107919 / 50-1 BON) TaxID=697281 RepID=F4A0W8_MAHA5|nr:hypothetical protein [Mahella australiensis]AEE98045.1 hypothetical protein Mahau_2924 [Mahella australiensis 50-1 BON]